MEAAAVEAANLAASGTCFGGYRLGECDDAYEDGGSDA